MANDQARSLSFRVAGPSSDAFVVVVVPSSLSSPSLSSPSLSHTSLSGSSLVVESKPGATLVAGFNRLHDNNNSIATTTFYSPYVHGLAGVNQPLNYLCINMLVIAFAVVALLALIFRAVHLELAIDISEDWVKYVQSD